MQLKILFSGYFEPDDSYKKKLCITQRKRPVSSSAKSSNEKGFGAERLQEKGKLIISFTDER